MKKRILSLCMVLALCLGLMPITAMAEDGDKVYVGDVELTGSTSNPSYAMTDDSGNVSTDGATAANYNIKWDGSTLTLNGAKIKGYTSSESLNLPVGIYVFDDSGNVSLNIELQGVNEIFNSSYGIWVYSSSSGTASLTIMGENGSSLIASGSSSGIQVQSNSGNGTLAITGAKVTASSSSSGNGVQIRVGDSSNASLTVNGGSLTATATGSNSGIYFLFGSSSSGSGKPSLTVSGNAMVKASGGEGGISDNSSTDIQIGVGNNSSGGIVFDNGTGAVYGEVTLQDDLTIGEDESMNIPSGASLDTNDKLTVNGGILTQKGNVTGDIIYKVTGVSLNTDSLTLEEGGTATLTATITPSNATNQEVKWSSNPSSIVDITVDSMDRKKATITAEGTGTTTITATVDGKSADCTVIVNSAASGIIADPMTLNFGSVREDYVIAPTAQTITNKGNQTINLNQPTANNFIIGTLSKTILASNEVATFTVQPKTNLEAGTYNEIITITGDNGASTSVTVSFVVTEKPYIPPYRPTDDSIGLSGITVDSEDKVDVEEVTTDRDVRDALGKGNIITTIQVEETDKPVEVTVEAGRDYREETVYVVQKNADDELVLVTVVEADSRGDIAFITESIEELTLTTYLPEGFINDVDGNTNYIKEDSEVAYGWLKLEDGWYFFDYETGIQQKDRWVAEYTDWYCLDADGRMYTSAWIARDSKLDVWYYVNEDGLMLTDTTTPDGYYVDAQGIWQA